MVTVLQPGGGNSSPRRPRHHRRVHASPVARRPTSRPTSTPRSAAPPRRRRDRARWSPRAAGSTCTAARSDLQITDNVIVGNSGSYGGARPRRHAVHRRRRQLPTCAHRPQPDPGQRRHEPRRWHRALRRQRRLLGRPQRPLRQLLRRVRRRASATSDCTSTARPAASITSNRIWLNAVLRRGRRRDGRRRAAAATSTQPSTGHRSGHASTRNLIQDNLANDDGGGIRFLQARRRLARSDVDRNNMIVDNISAHEGGGIALDDSTNVRHRRTTR